MYALSNFDPVSSAICDVQMSTSAQQTTEDAALEPTAETPWAALYVPVYLDTPEMDSPAQVI